MSRFDAADRADQPMPHPNPPAAQWPQRLAAATPSALAILSPPVVRTPGELA